MYSARNQPGFRGAACWFALLVLLAAGHAAASEGGSEIALVFQGDTRPEEALKDLLAQYGSKVTGVVLRPEGGGYLVSVVEPADATTAQALFDALGGSELVSHAESNVCYQFYPDDGRAETERVLESPRPPTPEQLVSGETQEYPSDTLQESPSEGGGKKFATTVTRDQFETETRVAVGWSMVYDPGTPIEYDSDSLACDNPTFLVAKTPDIKISLTTGSPGAFRYPRPLPLQVVARDYDEIQHGCSGCGGAKTNDRRYIEDVISLYKWDGDPDKGSLNRPYKNLDEDLQARIDKLKKEIADKSAELEKLKAKKDELDSTRDDRKAALDEEIKRLEEKKAEVQGKLDELHPKISQKESELDTTTEKLDAAKAKLEELQAEIDKLNEEIKELEDRIDGKPSAATQAIAARLEALEQQIEAKQADFEQLKARNVGEEQALAQAYDQALNNLVTARQNLAAARAQVVAKQNEILALENKLYSNPAILQAMRQQATLTRLAIDLQNRFLGGGLPQTQQLVQKAQQVFQATTPDLRQAALDAFKAEQARLLSALNQQCATSSSPGNCRDLLNELRAEADALSDTLTDAVTNPSAGGDPRDWERLDELRDELSALESDIRAAEQQVTAAEQAVHQAEQAYADGLQGLQDSESQKEAELADLQARAQETSVELTIARAKDEEERLEKTPDWLDQIAEKRTRIEKLEGELAAKRLEAELLQAEKNKLEDELRKMRAERTELEAQRDYLEIQIERKREEKEAIDKETDELQSKIDELTEELEDLEEKLKDLLAEAADAAIGKKDGKGQQVFFIPPPLEHTDGFDSDEFERLKKELAEKEAAYEKARAAKEQLQDDAYKLLKGFTEQLWALKSATKALEGLDEEIEEFDKEKAKRMTDVADERSKDVAKDKQRQEELNKEKTKKEGKVEDAEHVEEQDKKRVEDREQELKEATQAVSRAETEVAAKKSARDAKETERRAAHAEQSAKWAEFRRTVASLKEAEAKLGRAQSAVSRASVAKNDAALSTARAEVDRLEREIERLNAEIERQRGPLLQLDKKYAQIVKEKEQAEQALDDAEKDLRDKKKEFWDKVKFVKNAQDDLKQSMDARLTAERTARKAEDAVKRQEEKVKQAQEDADKAVEEDDEVKAADKKLEDKKEEKKDAEKAKNTALSKLAKLQEGKKEWDEHTTKAKDDLVKARDELDAARDALKQFLIDEFNNVEHKATLYLTVDDQPMDDGFRRDDEPRQVPITIKYEKKRPPTITGPDDDLDPPMGVGPPDAICKLTVGFVAEPEPTLAVTLNPTRDEEVGEDGLEPKTIALYYDQGAPLYDLWPPLPGGPPASAAAAVGEAGAESGAEVNAADTAEPAAEATDSGDDADSEEEEEAKEVLVHAATPYKANAVDTDEIRATCEPGEGIVGSESEAGGDSASASAQLCLEGGSSGGEPGDPPHALWATETYTSQGELKTMIDVPEVKPDECEGEPEFEVKYLDSGLQWNDEKTKKHKYKTLTGKLGDAPTEYSDFGKGDKIELRFQVYEGGHKGKAAQTIKWKVSGVQPDLDESKYGLGAGKAKDLELKTDGSGYSKVDFFLGERWGKATVTAKWMREDKECAEATMEIVRPLKLRLIKVGFAPKNGWKQGRKAFDGETKYEELAEALQGDGPERSSSIAVGLLDDSADPVDGKKILFSIVEPGEASIDPEEMETEPYGLAWSFAKDVPEEAQLKIKAEVEAELAPFTEPSEVEGSQSTETQNRFQIGPEGKRVTIETEEPFVPGEAYSSGATLVIEGSVGHIPLEFKKLQLECDEIVVDEDGIAIEGSVNWKATGRAAEPFTVPTFSFEFKLESLGFTAGNDATVVGKVKIPTRDDWVDFEATLGPEGFYGQVSNFPEIEVAGMKLEKGASFIVDMHEGKDPDGVDLKGNWRKKGLVIVKATLVLPESMKGDAEEPPKISVTNMYYNSTGLNGGIKVDYTVSAKLGKVEFAIEHIFVDFKGGDLDTGEFKGKITLADPFHGSIGATMKLDSAGKYSFEISTDKPVTAPSLGLTLMLRKVLVEYDQGTEVFTFELQALMRSKTFGDIDVNKFMVNSTGDIEVDIDVNKDIQFGKGFEVHVGSFMLKSTATEFEMGLKEVRLNFGEMLKGEIEEIRIEKGPKIAKFAASIEADRPPVSFEAEINYEADVFEGTVKVKAKVIEVEGTFILGTQKKEDDSEFTYWYVEMSVSGPRIPLGPPPPPPSMTGLGITKLGGGIGYNYDPPIGQAPGAVRYTDTFSFKAAITVGDYVSGGKVFASRLTMVLVSGKFSVNGKVWVLDKESSLYGEGQLDLYWKPSTKLEGFVRMVIALPGTEGKLLRFTGQVDFRYAGANDWAIKSRTLEGALLERLIAEGNIDIKPGEALLEGNVRYEISKTVPLAIVSLHVAVNLRADGTLEFKVTPTRVTLNVELSAHGDLDVTLETKVRNFDLAKATLDTKLTLKATNLSITVQGTAEVSWDTWVHSGSTSVDIGWASGQ